MWQLETLQTGSGCSRTGRTATRAAIPERQGLDKLHCTRKRCTPYCRGRYKVVFVNELRGAIDCVVYMQRFFHNAHVVRSEFGLDSLTISGRLFGAVTTSLILSNVSIELWSQGLRDDWEVSGRASPGDQRVIEQILQDHHLPAPNSIQQSVMSALYATGGTSTHDVQV